MVINTPPFSVTMAQLLAPCHGAFDHHARIWEEVEILTLFVWFAINQVSPGRVHSPLGIPILTILIMSLKCGAFR
jgi:hypothetical protein